MLIKKIINRFTYQAKRLPFKTISSDDINFFKSILQGYQVITDSQQLKLYNVDWRKTQQGHSTLMLRPNKTEQISSILSYCNQKNIAVVPQSGNTGLVGGSTPIFDEIILSMKDMNKVESFDPVSSVLRCQAGCILQKLNDYLLPNGFQVPLDLGAKGSCLIGGNASTNAGGKYVIKHGLFRSKILGLQVVLPSGKVLNLRSDIMKDNTGYDLKNIFVGSQGTLGIITKIDIYCAKIDKDRKIVVLKLQNYQDVIAAIPKIRQLIGKSLNALQYVDYPSYKAVLDQLPYQSIIQLKSNQHLLFVELTSNIQQIEHLLQELPFCSDSIMSNNDVQYRNIWRMRQQVGIALNRKGTLYGFDISINPRFWKQALDMMRKHVIGNVYGYGHIADGNLHLQIVLDKNAPMYDENLLFNYVIEKGGSISAQHCIGYHKANILHIQKSQDILSIYKQIKNIFDPNGILNPYKLLMSSNK